MIRHGKIRRLLFDHIKNETSPAERRTVEKHLEVCAACRRELETMRTALSATVSPVRPSDRLPDAYWDTFAHSVERRIERGVPKRAGRSLIPGQIELLLLGNRRWALASGAAAVAIGLLMLWQQPGTPPADPRTPVRNPLPSSTTGQRMDRVFRRGKALLVGLDNLRPVAGGTVDLSAERRASRELVEETRALRDVPMNPRSAMVVRDLERLLIELANTDTRASLPDVDIIRNGMRQENILFRLRMAEGSRDSIPVMRASDRSLRGMPE
jgi:hypothetical protein